MANSTHTFPSQAANVVVYDQSDGLFGELLDASSVIQSSTASAGQSSTPLSTRQLRSVRYGYPDNRSSSADIPVRFYNYSSSFLRIRWIDAKGNAPTSHTWTLAPNEDFRQSTVGGHIFILSVIVLSDDAGGGEQDLFGTNESEAVLGAFRPKRSLPSGSYHSVQVHDADDVLINSESGESNINGGSSYILEVVLSDQTSYDALVVASYWLDKEITSKQARLDTTKTLKKIILNITKDPTNEKYRKLRLSNGMVSRNISNHWSAVEFLLVLGFGKKKLANDDQRNGEEEYLIADNVPDAAKLLLYDQGRKNLELLCERCQPGFVADLAPPTPWDEPALLNGNGARSSGGGGGRWGNAGSTHFMSPDDRWERVERARRFRGRSGPRPSPGNAPSDRGRWGR